jgi:hypothetical protein
MASPFNLAAGLSCPASQERERLRCCFRIVLARGRDAADVPMIHTFGPHILGEFTVITEEVGESAAIVSRKAA